MSAMAKSISGGRLQDDPPFETYNAMKLRIQREEGELNGLKRADRAAEVEIKMRELDAKEKEVHIKDRELDIQERGLNLKRKEMTDKFELLDEAFKRYKEVRAYDSDSEGATHGTVEGHLAFKFRDSIEGF